MYMLGVEKLQVTIEEKRAGIEMECLGIKSLWRAKVC